MIVHRRAESDPPYRASSRPAPAPPPLRPALPQGTMVPRLAGGHAMSEMTERPRGTGLRFAVLLIAGIETALCVVIEFIALGQAIGSGEQLARSIGWGVATVVAVPFVLLVLPALLLGILGRWLKLALFLAALAVVAALVAYASM